MQNQKHIDDEERLNRVKRDIRELSDTFREALEKSTLDDRTHASHHEFVSMLIEKKKKQDARRERLKDQIIGISVIAFLSSMVGLVGVAVRHYIKQLVN